MRRAVVLAGGLGTRMRDVGVSTPKTLLDIKGQPLIATQLERLRAVGVLDVVMATGHLGELVAETLGDGSAYGVQLSYSHEAEPMGTGGALALAASRHVQPGDTLIVLNGDLISEHDLAGHIAAAQGSDWCIHVRHVDDARPYGVVRGDDEGRVLEFVEKPAEKYAALVNAGTYVTRGEVLAQLDPTRVCSLEREVFPAALAAGLDVRFHRDDAEFLDVGTPEAWAQATRDARR